MQRLKKVDEQQQHASSTGSVKVRRSPPRRCNQTLLARALGADRSSRARPEPIISVRRLPTKDEQALMHGEYIGLPPAGIARNSQLKESQLYECAALCAAVRTHLRLCPVAFWSLPALSLPL